MQMRLGILRRVERRPVVDDATVFGLVFRF